MTRLLNARFVTSALGVGAMLCGLAQACAIGDTDTSVDFADDDNGGSGGGVGGSGGSNLCDADCSLVTTPACLTAVCNDGSYPGEVGNCVVINDDGAACDDGLFCTEDESCLDGACGGGVPSDCGVAPGSCQLGLCDESTDTCITQAAADGTLCSSANLCLFGTTCLSGQCAGGTPNDCASAPVPDDCHVPVCNPSNGLCESVIGNEGGDCDDPSDLCTVNKTCAAGNCQGGGPMDCSQLTAGCDLGVCDIGTGTCMTQALTVGAMCDDLDACTTGETCQAGNSCAGGTDVTACSLTGDGCCPSVCTEVNDIDCACPGTFVSTTCVYVPSLSTTYASNTAAQAQCQSLGTGWDLCSPAMLCDPQTITYLGAAGCDCSGSATCACGSAANLYLHVTGASSPYYVRDPQIPSCISGSSCTSSVSESCGVAICCKP